MIVTVTLNPSIDREAEIDTFHYDDPVRMHNVNDIAGGKGVNVSRVARRLGQDTICLGFVGGIVGGMFLGHLEEEDIPQDLTPIGGETRTNLTLRDRSVSKIIKLNEPGPHVNENDLDRLLLTMDYYIHPDNFFVISGSLPEGLDSKAYTRLVEYLDGKVRGILVDAEGTLLQESLREHKIDYVKPNLHETERLLGQTPSTDGNFRKAIWKLHDIARTPIISAGSKGVYFENENKEMIHVPSPEVQVISPVGAGDAFVAGLLVGLQEGKTFLDAAKLGVACGAATARAGRLCEKDEALELLPLVKHNLCS